MNKFKLIRCFCVIYTNLSLMYFRKIVFYVLGLCQIAHAQGGLTGFSGSIIDNLSGLPVMDAIIQLEDGSFSTSINEEGNFIFRYPFIKPDSVNVHISCLGYKSIIRPISSFDKTAENEIFLEGVDQITTTLGHSNAASLVKEAIDSLQANNLMIPYLQQGFYREYASLAYLGPVKIKEALIRIERFPEESDEKVKVLRNRMVLWPGQSNKVEAWEMSNGPQILCRSLETELPDFLTEAGLKKYTFEVDSLFTMYDGLTLYVVNFQPKSASQKGGRFGRMYIDTKSKAIVRLSYELTLAAMADIMGKGNSAVRVIPQSLVYTSQFRKAGDKWVLHENNAKVVLRYQERLERAFDTIAEWNYRLITTETIELRGAKLANTTEEVGFTNDFEKRISLSPNYWGIKNYLLPTAEMKMILENINQKEYFKR